ncbi:MAG TPA: hypothetical protein VKF60_11815 [Myxococcota bacterium]|nr:hypothetical protein [Myxococcota bacterium]
MRAGCETSAESLAEREVVIARVFDAPRKLLFEAYGKPAPVLIELCS